MGFPLSDLILESVIREGLENLRRMPEIIDDLFSQLGSLPNSLANKYGQKELNKIKTLVQDREVSIIQAFPINNTPMPCISLQLLAAQEDVPLAAMDDYQEEIQVPMSSEDLAAQILASNVSLLSYDSFSGVVGISDATDLSSVHINHLLVDSSGNEFYILGGINNTTGSKSVIIKKQANLNIVGPSLIKSSINYDQYQVRTNVEKENILLGIHTKDMLTTKYLYTIIKYIIESRKKDLIDRGFILATYEGSDFNINERFESDFIYSRYLTVSGRIYNTWNSDQVIPIDYIDVDVRVPKATADNQDLGLTNSTIKVTDD
jgi:hypothetical protein